MKIRHIQSSDYPPIINILSEWWGGRKVGGMLPHLFFEHFCNTSYMIEEDDQLVAFLIGFLSQSQPEEAYIHFVGVNPRYRLRGFGRLLYERFFEFARQNQCHVVRCITAPINKTSIAFHTRLGFHIEPGAAEMDGVQYDPNHDGPGEDRVRFIKNI